MKKDALKAIEDILLHTKETKADSIKYAKEMKTLHPNKQDYGFGEAGYTLNDWQEMKAFFLNARLVTAAGRSHKVISQTYRKMVGQVVDDLLARSLINTSYLGKCCWHGTVKDFLDTTQNRWMDVMTERYPQVSPFTLSASKKNAWKPCYVPLKKALKSLGDKYLKAFLTFEYALPLKVKNGDVIALAWPDALFITEDTILVLEFKNKPLNTDAAEKYLQQTEKYRKRLEKYHLESRNKQIVCILVSTKMKDTSMVLENGILCSGDRLGEAMIPIIHVPGLKNCQKWLLSDFAI